MPWHLLPLAAGSTVRSVRLPCAAAPARAFSAAGIWLLRRDRWQRKDTCGTAEPMSTP